MNKYYLRMEVDRISLHSARSSHEKPQRKNPLLKDSVDLRYCSCGGVRPLWMTAL